MKLTVSRLLTSGAKPAWFKPRRVPLGPRIEQEIDLLISRVTDKLRRSGETLSGFRSFRGPAAEDHGGEWLVNFGPNSWEHVELRGPAEWQNEWEVRCKFQSETELRC